MVASSDRLHDQGAVLDRPRQRPGAIHCPAQRKSPVATDPPERRLEADDAAHRRRVPYRAATVGTQRTVDEARCDGRTGPRRRSAGNMIQVPGIEATSKMRVLAGSTGCKFVEVQRAEMERPRGFQALEDRSRELSRTVEHFRAGGRDLTLAVKCILVRKRHAVQWSVPAPIGNLLVGTIRSGQRGVCFQADEAIYFRLNFRNPRQCRFGRGSRRHLLPLNRTADFGQAEVRQGCAHLRRVGCDAVSIRAT